MDLNKLGLQGVKFDVEDFEHMPDETAFTETPYPGRYTLATGDNYDREEYFSAFDAADFTRSEGKTKVLAFRAPFIIIAPPAEAPPDCPGAGAEVMFRLTNQKMERGQRGSGQFASELGLWLVHSMGETKAPQTAADWVAALIRQRGGRQFTATVTISARCDPNKAARFDGEEHDGQDGRMGCAAQYVQYVTKKKGMIPQHTENGKRWWALRFTCAGRSADGSDCGASLRCFANLREFGMTKKMEAK